MTAPGGVVAASSGWTVDAYRLSAPTAGRLFFSVAINRDLGPLVVALRRIQAHARWVVRPTMAHDTPAIEITNLARRYGRTDVVDGSSLRVRAGRCYGFFGRSGARKTTIITCVFNLLRPASGRTRISGTRSDVPRALIDARFELGFCRSAAAWTAGPSVRLAGCSGLSRR
jgi:ABC-type multidrug transport system fused ATPase/permease subunit